MGAISGAIASDPSVYMASKVVKPTGKNLNKTTTTNTTIKTDDVLDIANVSNEPVTKSDAEVIVATLMNNGGMTLGRAGQLEKYPLAA